MGYNDAVIIELSQVPCELICAICHELMRNPLQTPCNHLFCAECITQSVQVYHLCPIDRLPLTAGKLIPIQKANPILYRIWNKIKLRCPYAVPNSCPWTGPPESFEAHMSACACSNGSMINKIPRESIKTTQLLDQKISNQDLYIQSLTRDITNLNLNLSNQTDATRDMSRLYDAMKEENRLLKQRIENIRITVDVSYNYQLDDTVDLAQLIFQDRESLPSGIDRNRIYQSITNIGRVYNQYSYEEEPEIGLNFKMLLAIASASSWFTYNQGCHLQTMLSQTV